jgi:RimJ/RimL family protein N-acetyltransferase
MAEIRTERLLLRPARHEDTDAMHAVLSDPWAMRYWSTLPHTDVEQTRAWVAAMVESHPDAEDFIVEFEGRVIGKAGFWRLPEIGYILHPQVWGRGLATEALSAVIGHVFAVRPVDKLTADVDPRNGASLRLLQRLGFVRTGYAENTLRLGDEMAHSIYLELTREGFSSR